MTRLKWLKLIFLRYYRSMGLRVFLYALLSVAATLLSPIANMFIGIDLKTDIDFASVTPVLTILASSMLAVSTFSLSIMVSAHRAAANTATPRMHRILLEDTTTQSVLSVFIGAFVYSLGSLVLYRLGFYPDDAALVVMAVTTLVVVAVILSLLRWINHLTTLGSLQNSLETAQARAEDALLGLAHHPRFGASELTEDTVLPTATTPLRAPQSGYLQLIDMAMLQDRLPEQTVLYLNVTPGRHVLVGDVIGQVSGSIEDALCDELLGAFTFGTYRTHEQDAEFGLGVISEIGLKALSPSLNDPGTAVEAILLMKTLLWRYAQETPDKEASTAPNVVARFPEASDFIEAAFAPIARQCDGSFDVQLCLLESLAALHASDNGGLSKAAHELAGRMISALDASKLTDEDLNRLRSAAPKAAA